MIALKTGNNTPVLSVYQLTYYFHIEKAGHVIDYEERERLNSELVCFIDQFLVSVIFKLASVVIGENKVQNKEIITSKRIIGAGD